MESTYRGVICRRPETETSTTEMFYKDLEERIFNFDLPEPKVNEIYCLVNEIVHKILTKVSEQDDRFTFSEIINVGSIAEGTRLSQPNEFDYLCILKDLSKPDIVKCSTDCGNYEPGYVHVLIRDEYVRRKWENRGDNFTCNEDGSLFAHKIFVEFYKLISAIRMELKKENKSIMVTGNFGTLLFIEHTLGYSGPNVELHMKWTPVNAEPSLEITVDVSLAIRYSQMQDIPMSPVFATSKEVQNVTSVLLLATLTCIVPEAVNHCEGRCFRISCTEVEVQIMKSLSEHHTSCYKILKYILSYLCEENWVPGLLSYTPLSSFIIKTAVMEHSFRCTDCLIKKKCMDDVANFLLACFIPKDRSRPFMSNIFLKENNLLFKKQFIHNDVLAINCVMQYEILSGFKELQEKLEEMNSSQYNFKQCTRLLLDFIKRLGEVGYDIDRKFYKLLKANGSWNFNGSSTELVDLFECPVPFFSH